MTYLLDVSCLLALLWDNHVHHSRMQKWQVNQTLALCPISELGFLRVSTVAFNAPMDDARQSLSDWIARRAPGFIPCDERVLTGLRAPNGSKTADFYLAHLAEAHGMKLATLDTEIAHPASFLIPD